MQPTNKQRKQKQKRSAKQNNAVVPVRPKFFRTLQLVFPPRMNMKLKYWAYGGFPLSTLPYANYRWRPTGAFDVDPALGGTAMAGFAELATFYASYRVVASKCKISVTNPSSVTPVTCVLLPTNADPTNSMTQANIVASVGNPYAVTKETGLSGAPPTVLVCQMTTEKIYGDPAVYFDHNFSSLVTTVPANNWFWNFAVTATALIPTNPVTFQSEIDVDVEFFDRIFLPA